MEQTQQQQEQQEAGAAHQMMDGVNHQNEVEEGDDMPAFIDMNDVVEVKVDDDVPMDDDDDDDEGAGLNGGENDEETGIQTANDDNEQTVTDMSKLRIESHSDAVYSVACSVENGRLAILSGGGDDKAFLHRVESSQPPAVASQLLPYNHADTVSCVAYNMAFVTEDSKKTPRLAAVGGYDGAILIYDPDTAEQKLKLEGPSDVEWLCFHPKGGSVLLAGSGDGTVWMFHIPLNRCLQVFVGHEQAVTAGSFSPDGKVALSASADGTLRIWAPKTGMNKHVFRTGEAGLTCLATDGGTDHMLVMVGAEDGQAHLCHIGTKKIVASLRHYEVPQSTASTNQTNSMDEDEDDAEVEYPMSVEAVGFCASQPNWCATAGVDGKLKIWDLTTGQCRQVCIPPDFTPTSKAAADSITRLRWHPTLPVVFTTSISGRIRLWDARSGRLVHTLTGHTDVINDVDFQFLENGTAVVVTASDDHTIRAFEVDVNAALQQAAATAPIGTMQ